MALGLETKTPNLKDKFISSNDPSRSARAGTPLKRYTILADIGTDSGGSCFQFQPGSCTFVAVLFERLIRVFCSFFGVLICLVGFWFVGVSYCAKDLHVCLSFSPLELVGKDIVYVLLVLDLAALASFSVFLFSLGVC